jgi:hypothetical protein
MQFLEDQAGYDEAADEQEREVQLGDRAASLAKGGQDRYQEHKASHRSHGDEYGFVACTEISAQEQSETAHIEIVHTIHPP